MKTVLNINNAINNKRKIVWVFILIITSIAAFLRIYEIGEQPLWNDETFSYYASNISLSSMFNLESNMSLYYFITHWWIRIIPNTTEGLLRLPSALFSIISIPLIYQLGKQLDIVSKNKYMVGIIASILVTFNAFHIQYAQEFRSYSLLTLLTALSTLILIKAIKRNSELPDMPNPWWFWYSLVAAGSVYSHFFALFIIFAHGVSLLVLRKGDNKNFPLQEAIGSTILIGILVFPALSEAYFKGTGGLTWIEKPTLESIKQFAIRITGNQGPYLLSLYLVTLTIGFIFSIRSWFSNNIEKRWKSSLLVGCLFVPIILSLLLSFALTPIFLDRYLILTMPFLAILSAYGIVTISSTGRKLQILSTTSHSLAAIILLFIISLSNLGIRSYFEVFQKEDWRSAAQYLTKNCSNSKSLRLYYMTHIERNSTFYNPHLKSQIENWTELINSRTQTDEIDSFKSLPFEKACLILSHVSSSNRDTQKRIESALESKFSTVTTTNFYQVEIKQYQ